MKLYREVKTSERHPRNGGFYFTRRLDNNYGGVRLFYDGEFDMGGADVWLEPIEITEEDLDDIIYQAFKRGSGSYSENSINASKSILSKLSGE